MLRGDAWWWAWAAMRLRCSLGSRAQAVAGRGPGKRHEEVLEMGGATGSFGSGPRKSRDRGSVASVTTAQKMLRLMEDWWGMPLLVA